jgi:hypothetical protein
MQRWTSSKATKKLRDRVHELTSSRQSGRDVKQLIAELTPVLRGGGTTSGQGMPTGSSTRWTTSYCSDSASGIIGGRSAGPEAFTFYRRSALRTAQVNGHGEISDASHTPKIIVKPCAGKRHARFERGCNGTGSASLIPRHHLPMCGGPMRALRRCRGVVNARSLNKHIEQTSGRIRGEVDGIGLRRKSRVSPCPVGSIGR